MTYSVASDPITDPGRAFVTTLARTAFLVRLGALVFGLVGIVGETLSVRLLTVILLIAGTSAVGLYRDGLVVRLVRRHPFVAVGDILLAALATALVGVSSPLLLYTLSTALLIGVLLPLVAAALAGTVLVLSYVLAAVLTDVQYTQDDFVLLLVMPVTYVVLVVLGALVRRLHERVLLENEQAARLRVASTAAEERARLAREMHDSVAKTLHGIALAASALPAWIEEDPGGARARARDLAAAAEDAAGQARGILVRMRADQLDRPLLAVLAERVLDFRDSTGIPAEFSGADAADVDHHSRYELVAILAEALTNVDRHARADTVTVRCSGDAETVSLVVEDDGVGFAPGHDTVAERDGHFGIRGMSERAHALGGRLDVTSEPGAGTRITVQVPRRPPAGGVRNGAP